MFIDFHRSRSVRLRLGWDGVRQGLITSGLNHAMHAFSTKFFSNNPDITKTIKEYEKNEKTIYKNSIKAEALTNFTSLGQLKSLVEKATSEWLGMGADVGSSAEILMELNDAFLAFGIVTKTTFPEIQLAAGIIKTYLFAENLYLQGVNNYYLKPQIIRHAPNYAYNKGLMNDSQKEEYFKACKCGGKHSGGGSWGSWR